MDMPLGNGHEAIDHIWTGFLLLAIQGVGIDSQTLLEIRDLRSSYQVSDAVAFNLASCSDKVLFYGVGVEQRTETGWREIVPNIEEVIYSPTYKYRRLAPHQIKHLVWNVKASVPGVPISPGAYRFFIALEKHEGGFDHYNSRSFSLRQAEKGVKAK
jgi:hypothetical protein